MTYEEYAGFDALAEQDEPFFIVGMIFIEKLTGVLVVENGLGFFERDAMFSKIRTSFGLAPLELNHTYIVCIYCKVSRRALTAKSFDPSHDLEAYGLIFGHLN
jgi:hypothetical protein